MVRLRRSVSDFLNLRSALRYNDYEDASFIGAVYFMVAAVPLAVITFLLLSIRRLFVARIRLVCLAIPGEFSKFIKYMESLRNVSPDGLENEIVLVLSKGKQRTLSQLYANSLNTRILWGAGFAGLMQQALLMQPTYLVQISRHDARLGADPYVFPRTTLQVSAEFQIFRQSVLEKLGFTESTFVAMAIREPGYDLITKEQKFAGRVATSSNGIELAPVIDSLTNRGIPVVLLGSPDVNESHIPCDIPRLHQFGELGGPHEVALSSVCMYFWSDDVGAWWLSAPFHRPILISNMTNQRPRGGMLPENHLVLPVRYQTLEGRDLTFREIYSKPNPYHYKAWTRGEIAMKRNSTQEILEAQDEMIGRCDGRWMEGGDAAAAALQRQYSLILDEFPHIQRLRIASSFLARYPHLVES